MRTLVLGIIVGGLVATATRPASNSLNPAQFLFSPQLVCCVSSVQVDLYSFRSKFRIAGKTDDYGMASHQR